MMAWNEPGSNDQKNPWNRGGKQQGPPDLDEIARKIRDKLISLMGGKKRSPRPSGNGSAGGKGAGQWSLSKRLFFAAVFALWVLSGIYIISPMKRGVVLRFGQYARTVQPGPHWLPRFVESYNTVNVQEATSFTYTDEMLTRDGNIVSVELSVMYRRDNVRDFLFNVKDPQGSIKQATASALRQVVGDSVLDEILTTGRQKIRDEVHQQLVSILQAYKTGIEIIDVNLQPVKPPEAVTEAFDDVIKARKDEKRFINEAEAYASQYNATVVGQVERIMREAEGEKERLVADALADVAQFKALRQLYRAQPEVMRIRMYLDAFESVLSKSSKVLVATKSGQNILYLPLDKIMESQRQNNRDDSTSVEGVTAANNVDPDLPIDTAATQLTEGVDDHRLPDPTRGGYQWQQ
jgi:membrane protease subunit HflK